MILRKLLTSSHPLSQKLRKNLAARLFRISGGMPKPGDGRPIGVWPPVRTASELEDLLPRLAWTIPAASLPATVLIPAHPSIAERGLKGLHVADYLGESLYPACVIRFVAGGSAAIRDTQLILVRRVETLLRIPRNLWDRCAVVDTDFSFLMEAASWTRLVGLTQNQTLARDIRKESEENFLAFLDKAKGFDSINLFGKGNSIKEAFAQPFAATCNIVCNSIVKSREFLSHVRPTAITCADAAHHYGPSRYAERFRKDLAAAALEYGAYVFVNAGAAHYLLATHYPELRPYLIALGISPELSVPTVQKPNVKMIPNILSQMMLPVAYATGVRKVFIWGCEGRASADQKKQTASNKALAAWARSPDVEYEDLIPGVRQAHSAYFRDANVDRYYDIHCRTLQEVVEFGEALGFAVACRTPTYIPALRSRMIT